MQSDKMSKKQRHWTWQVRHKGMLTQKAIIGRVAENLVCWYLVRRGWVIRRRNYSTHKGEIDIVAEKMGADLSHYPTVSFVEVKSKSTRRGLPPDANVCATKKSKLVRTARVWIGEHAFEKAVYRFDIASVVMEARRIPRIRYIRNAFVGKEEFGW